MRVRPRDRNRTVLRIAFLSGIFTLMPIQSVLILAFVNLIIMMSSLQAQQPTSSTAKPEDTEVWQPVPKVVIPGANSGDSPSYAIILIDVKNLDEWVSAQDHSPAKWIVHDGVATVNKAAGNMETKRS